MTAVNRVAERGGSTTPPRDNASARPGGTDRYLRYFEVERVPDRPGPSQQFIVYVAGGIRRLAAAIDAVAERDSILADVVPRRLERLRKHANAVEQAATSSPAPARDASEAFLLAASLLHSMHHLRYRSPGPDRAGVWEAARAVQPGRSLDAQRSEVESFFEGATRMVQAMLADRTDRALSAPEVTRRRVRRRA